MIEIQHFAVMNLGNIRIGGLLLFVGVAQVVILQIVCETIFPSYSVSQQVISDLGNWVLAGSFAAVFNVSAVLFDLLIVAGAYFVGKEWKNRPYVALMVLVGACNVGWESLRKKSSQPFTVSLS